MRGDRLLMGLVLVLVAAFMVTAAVLFGRAQQHERERDGGAEVRQ